MPRTAGLSARRAGCRPACPAGRAAPGRARSSSSQNRSPFRLISTAPASNSAGEGASAVVTKLITNGRRSACGMWSSDQAMKLPSKGQGGSRRTRLSRCGGTKRISGPSARSPLTMRAPSSSAIAWPSPVAVGLTPFDLGGLLRDEAALELGAAGEVAGREHDAARARGCAPDHRSLDADHPAAVLDQPSRGGVAADLDPDPSRVPFQVLDVGARVRQHVVHARHAMRRLRHRAVEAHAEREQPGEGLGHVLAQDAAQRLVVARRQIAARTAACRRNARPANPRCPGGADAACRSR